MLVRADPGRPLDLLKPSTADFFGVRYGMGQCESVRSGWPSFKSKMTMQKQMIFLESTSRGTIWPFMMIYPLFQCWFPIHHMKNDHLWWYSCLRLNMWTRIWQKWVVPTSRRSLVKCRPTVIQFRYYEVFVTYEVSIPPSIHPSIHLHTHINKYINKYIYIIDIYINI